MFKKYLEKKIKIDSIETTKDMKKNIELEYYLVESDSVRLDGLLEDKVYGIEIIKKTEGKNFESEIVRNLSSCIEIAKNILEKLAYNTVTPVALPFVIDDLIGV